MTPHPQWPRLLRKLLLPLSPLFAAGATLDQALYTRGWRRRSWLRNPVLSVGSLSAGGAGKTPVVLMLADALERHGLAVRILTRGYGRTSSAVEQVDPAGDPARYGDEPLMMARLLDPGIPVFVGASRLAAGRLAESIPVPGHRTVHLLDDGFQHRRLGREIDLVLFTVEDLRDSMLPAGNRREPLRSLARADIILLRDDEAPQLQVAVERLAPRALIWRITRSLTFSSPLPVKGLLAFCALARPEGFAASLVTHLCTPIDLVAFRDHHTYTDRDVEHLVDRARALEAAGFITTQKDEVKLTPAMQVRLRAAAPLIVAHLTVTLHDESQAMVDLLALLDRRITQRDPSTRRP